MGSGMGMGTNAFGNSQYRFATRQQGDFVGADLGDINPGLLGGLTGASGGAGRSGRTAGAAGSTGLGSSLATGTEGASPFGGSMGRRSGNNSGRYGRRSSSGAYGASGGNQQMLLGLDLDFEVNAPPDATLSSAVTQRLAQSMRLPTGAPLAVSVQGGTAVLRGSVATSHDRALAEQLVLLEPGIVRVANELEVAPNGATIGKAQAPGNSRPATSAVLPPR
jgi:hypothetical protein